MENYKYSLINELNNKMIKFQCLLTNNINITLHIFNDNNTFHAITHTHLFRRKQNSAGYIGNIKRICAKYCSKICTKFRINTNFENQLGRISNKGL